MFPLELTVSLSVTGIHVLSHGLAKVVAHQLKPMEKDLESNYTSRFHHSFSLPSRH